MRRGGGRLASVGRGRAEMRTGKTAAMRTLSLCGADETADSPEDERCRQGRALRPDTHFRNAAHRSRRSGLLVAVTGKLSPKCNREIQIVPCRQETIDLSKGNSNVHGHDVSNPPSFVARVRLARRGGFVCHAVGACRICSGADDGGARDPDRFRVEHGRAVSFRRPDGAVARRQPGLRALRLVRERGAQRSAPDRAALLLHPAGIRGRARRCAASARQRTMRATARLDEHMVVPGAADLLLIH